MVRARSLHTFVALSAVGALAVVGLDTVSYAAGGPSVLLGKDNSAAKTTTIASKSGPALSLKSKPGKASLAVSSTKLVKHLNAQMTGGKSASVLEPKTTLYKVGAAGDPIPAIGSYQLAVPAGTYRVTLSIFSEDASGFFRCYVFPLGQASGNPSDFSNVLGTEGISVLSASGVIKMPTDDVLAMGCEASGGTLAAPGRVTLQKLSSVGSGTFPSAPPAERPGGRFFH